jgi:hypothetical protein
MLFGNLPPSFVEALQLFAGKTLMVRTVQPPPHDAFVSSDGSVLSGTFRGYELSTTTGKLKGRN